MAGFQDGQKYRIQNVQDSLFVDLNNGGDDGPEIVTNPEDPASVLANWTAAKSDQEEGGFVLIAPIQAADGDEQLAIDKATDTNLVSLYPVHGDLHQVWIPISVGDDRYVITSARDGLALQSQGPSNQLKCVESDLENPQQQWRIIAE